MPDSPVETASPMKDQVRPRAFVAREKKKLCPLSEKPPELSVLAHRVLPGLERQCLAVRRRAGEHESVRRDIQANQEQTGALIGTGALILSGMLVLLLVPGSLLSISAAQTLGFACFVVGGLFLAANCR